MPEDNLVEQRSFSKETKDKEALANLVADYVPLGEIEIAGNKKVNVSVGTTQDIDDNSIRVLRIVEGEMDEDLSEHLGKGKKLEITDKERKVFRQLLERKVPLSIAAHYAFNESEESADNLLNRFPKYPNAEDPVLNGVLIGVVGPASSGKTSSVVRLATSGSDHGVYNFDPFSKSNYTSFLKEIIRNHRGGLPISETEIASAATSLKTRPKIPDSFGRGPIPMRVKMITLAADPFLFGANEWKSNIILDCPETVDSAKREPDVFDLVVKQGLDANYDITQMGNIMIQEKDEFRSWLKGVHEKSGKIRNYLLDNLN